MTPKCRNAVKGRRDHCALHEPAPYQSSKEHPLPPNWSMLRQSVLLRDGGWCKFCGKRATEVDHIISRAEGGTHDLNNLISTCKSCHHQKTQEEARRGRIRNRRERYR